MSPARSEAQRKLLNARFGHAWVKRHHYDNEGPLPAKVGKKKSKPAKAKKKKEKPVPKKAKAKAKKCKTCGKPMSKCTCK